MSLQIGIDSFRVHSILLEFTTYEPDDYFHCYNCLLRNHGVA